VLSKRTSLSAAVASIPDGAIVALGGNTFHRGPGAAVHELVRQQKRGLDIVKTAGAYDVDLLCAAGCVQQVSAGYVGYESIFGLAPSYRRSVEAGNVVAAEHACYTVISGMRAAIQGVPFMPVAGMTGSDLPAARDFRWIADPYTGANVVVVPALQPDVAVIHVHESDEFGNARITGSLFEDVLMAQSARRVILTAERIVDGAAFLFDPSLAAISSLYVDAVVEVTNGAWPFGCASLYEPDLDFMAGLVRSGKSDQSAAAWIDEHLLQPSAV
jgi:glutaconate CoA-transferase subunit A